MNRPATTPERAAVIVAWIAIVLGVVARAWALSQRGSLWLDEASLAMNVLTRGFGELLQPLDWGQAAPVGFLWIERALSSHAEVPDSWLRIVPWCAGVVLPWLLWRLGRRMVGTGAGALAAVAGAGSLMALRYSTEAKPYASDAAVAAVLMLLACEAAAEPQSMRRWWALAAAMVLAVPLSLPAVFVIAAVAVALAASAEVRAARGARLVALPALALAAATFGALWISTYSAGAANPSLRAYWAPVMLDLGADDRAIRVVRVFMELTWIPLRWTGSLLGTAAGSALWIGGLVFVARRRGADALLLAGPALFAMGASVLGAYPLSDRLAFFAVPGVWVAQAAALVAMRNRLLASRSIVANARAAAVFVVVASVGLAIWQATDADRFLRNPGQLEPTRALFAMVDNEAATTPIYVFARSAPAWLLATGDGQWRANPRLDRWTALAGRAGAPGYENSVRARAVRPGEGDSLIVTSGARTELVGLAPGVEYHIAGAPSAAGPSARWADEEARRLLAAARPDVWLVASHFFPGSSRNELRPLVEAAAALGLRVAEERHAGDEVVGLRLTR
ncbi:MAG: glycosyltransferase family 39 protein [Gemmatimonadaceae bacterium]|nr:glycosyltransferase family 39 protein [Gemmatimonadaceae bacterium]